MSEDTNIDIDSLLDSTLDDLEDLPEFKPFPAGAHRVLVSFETKEIGGHPSVEVACKMVETMELANPTSDTTPKAGDEASMLCMLDNEFGRGALKAVAEPLGEALGTGVIREVIEQTKDIECLIVTSIRKNKESGAEYLNIKELQVV